MVIDHVPVPQMPWSRKVKVTRETVFLLPQACLQEIKTLQCSQATTVLKQVLAGDFKDFSSPLLPLNIKEAVVERVDFANPAFAAEKRDGLLRVLEE